jgi:hypothetical protein
MKVKKNDVLDLLLILGLIVMAVLLNKLICG